LADQQEWKYTVGSENAFAARGDARPPRLRPAAAEQPPDQAEYFTRRVAPKRSIGLLLQHFDLIAARS